MKCRICEMMKDKGGLLYEDEKAFAFLSRRPAAPGHIMLATKEHYPILENVPDDVISHIFPLANKLSTITFETLGAHGTNIMVNNGITAGQKEPHFMVNIIPRREDDGLKLEWSPKKPPESELEDIHATLGASEQAEEPAPEQANTEEAKDEDPGDKDYLLDSLIRIP